MKLSLPSHQYTVPAGPNRLASIGAAYACARRNEATRLVGAGVPIANREAAKTKRERERERAVEPTNGREREREPWNRLVDVWGDHRKLS